MNCTECAISLEELYQAREVFITNAFVGLKWVSKIGNHNFINPLSSNLYKNCIAPLWK